MQTSDTSLRGYGMKSLAQRLCLAVTFGFVLGASLLLRADDDTLAKLLHSAIGPGKFSGGLCVLVDCRDPELAVGIARRGRFLVHCLYSDTARVKRAREDIRSRGTYGTVSADRLPPGRLPYTDNLANMIVCDDAKIPAAEIMRVLVPNGVAFTRSDGRWTQAVKPRPKDIDEWTHSLHGADGNAVAKDRVTGPPRHVQWVERPLWQRHHNTVPSVTAMVSSNGRLFYIADEAAAGIDSIPDRWFLVARDAFNGVLLWKRAIAEWGWEQWSDRSIARFNQPTLISRRLTAVGNRVYVTLGFNAPLTALDAATGKTVRTYAGTEFTDEILCHRGTLILSVSRNAQKPVDRRKKEKPEISVPAKKRILAVNAETGARLWETGDLAGIASKWDAMAPMTHLTLAIGGGQVFFLEEDAVVALDFKTGRERWRAPRPRHEKIKAQFGFYCPNLCTLVYHEGTVLLGQPDAVEGHVPYHPVPTTLVGFDTKTGKQLWTFRCGNWCYDSPPDVFVAQRLAWVHTVDPFALAGVDPKTGQEKRRFSTEKALRTAHHHRCYRNRATERFVLTGRRGIEFLDLESEKITCNHWVRGTCRFGVLPCNGLVYAPPHPCICYVTAKLTGLYALAPENQKSGISDQNSERLERGPAYEWNPPAGSKPAGGSPADWPTYRHDSARSGFTNASVPANLKQAWQTDIGGRLSSVVIADGKLFVASVDTHTVHALDAASGERLWRYTAGGRVDTPPTIHNSMALFGSADGWVYCLRASDGALVWRFRAAPDDRRLVAFGQVESAWPVPGSVLVKDNVAYVCAGRSSFLDGGIRLYALDPRTGKALQQTCLYSPEPNTGEMAECRLSYDMPDDHPGALPDVLAADETHVYMRHLAFDPKDIRRPTFTETAKLALRGGTGKKPGEPVLHLFPNSGFLDDAWFNQTYWSVNARSHSKLLVFDRDCAYGIKPFRGRHRHSRALLRPGTKGYTLFANDHLPQQAVPQERPDARPKGKKKRTKEPPMRPRWSVQVPVRVRAMALAGETLFIAGPPDVVDIKDPWAAFEGKKGAVLWAVSASDGKKLSACKLDSAPVFDGMAAASGRLYLSTQDGGLLCFAGAE